MKQEHWLRGRPTALFVLDYGLFRVHANGRVIGICGYVLRTDADEVILIDTGFPAKYAEDPRAAALEDGLEVFGEVLELGPEHLPEAQLARLGLTCGDVDLLVISHTHIDHIGGLADFPGVPIVIAAAERALPRPLYWAEAQPMEWPERDYRLVDGDVEIGPGLAVYLVPGHAPGQLAFAVDLPETGAVMLTIDAISRPAEIAERFVGSWDEAAACASAARLMALAEARGAEVIYGHCPDQWPGLRKAPEGFL